MIEYIKGDRRGKKLIYDLNEHISGIIMGTYTIVFILIYAGYLLAIIQENVRHISIYESSLFQIKTLGSRIIGNLYHVSFS